VSQRPRSAAQHTRQTIDIVETLKRSYLFAELEPATLTPLAERSRLDRYAPGEHVFFKGDPATHLHIVARGQVKEYMLSSDGQETITELYGPGSVFGDPGLFAVERDRVVSVAAVQRSTVAAIARADLMPFLFNHPNAMERMLEGLSSQIRDAVHVIATLRSNRILDRLAIQLLDLAESHGASDPKGTRITLALSQSLLASMIGATRPNVNRAIRQLVESGALIVDRDQYTLPNPQQLRAEIAPERRPLYQRNRPNRTDE
jgi:CRP-like cAMP-binding protein